MAKAKATSGTGATCPECGFTLSPTAKFCGRCGTVIGRNELGMELVKRSPVTEKPAAPIESDLLLELPPQVVEPPAKPAAEAPAETAPEQPPIEVAAPPKPARRSTKRATKAPAEPVSAVQPPVEVAAAPTPARSLAKPPADTTVEPAQVAQPPSEVASAPKSPAPLAGRAATGRFCPYCGAETSAKSKFCGACGAAKPAATSATSASPARAGAPEATPAPPAKPAATNITPAPPATPDAGREAPAAQVSAGGQEAARPQPQRTAARTRASAPPRAKGTGISRRAIAGFIGLIAVALLVVWVVLPEGDDSGGSTGISYPSGSTPARSAGSAPTGGPVKLTHPSGAQVSAPAGTFTPNAQVRLETLEKAPPIAPFVASAPIYKLRSNSLLAPAKPVTLDLPAGSAGDRAVVLVFAGPTWLRVPSQPVTLADGKPGQRVTFDRLPTPWVFTVAAPPRDEQQVDRQLINGTSPSSVLARLEQLRWTDRAGFAKEVAALDPEKFSRKPIDRAPWDFVRVAEAAERTVREELYAAKVYFYKAKVEVDKNSAATAFQQYRQGLERLWAARMKYDPILDPVREGDVLSPDTAQLGKTSESIVYLSSLELYLGDMIQYDCGRFAPWGLQLILTLAKEGLINEKEFDIRVLPFYGDLQWTDIGVPKISETLPLPPRKANSLPLQSFENDQIDRARQLNIVEGKVNRTQFVRVYSPSVMDVMSVAEILSNAKDVNSYVSAAVAAVGLASGAAEGAAAVWAAWEVAQPIVEALFLQDKIDGVKGSKGPAIGMAVATGYEAVNGLGGFIIDGMDASEMTPYGFHGMYTDALLTWAIDLAEKNGDSLELLTGLRDSTSGAQGYLDKSMDHLASGHFAVPPIMLLSALWGPTSDSPKNYPRGAQAFLMWSLRYNTISLETSYDLDGAFPKLNEQTKKVERNDEFSTVELTERLKQGKSLLTGLKWAAFNEDQWMAWRYDTEPVQQQMRFGIDGDVLKEWAKTRGIPVDNLQKQITLELSEGGCALCRLVPDNASKKEITLAEARRGGDDKTTWYAVRVHGWTTDWPRPKVPDSLVPADYAGPLFRFKNDSYRPIYQYMVRLTVPDEKGKPEVLAEIPIVFKREEVKSFLGEEALRAWDPSTSSFVDRNKPEIYKPAAAAFLRPGVWSLGKGLPREVVLAAKDGKLVGGYQVPGGQLGVEVSPVACSSLGAAKKPSYAICFRAVWSKPKEFNCKKWDVHMVGGGGSDGKSYDAVYSATFDCTETNPAPNTTPFQFDFSEEGDVKGKWLRDYTGGPVDNTVDDD